MGIFSRILGRETVTHPEQRSLTSWDLLQADSLGLGLAESSGQVVSHRSAEQLSAILACVGAVSSAIAALPAYVYRWEGKARVLAEGHPLQRLIARGPNAHQSWPDFCEWMVASALLRGNGLAATVTDAAGRVAELRPIPWDRVSVVELPRDRIAYDVTDDARGGTRRLLMEEVYHLRDRSDDGRIGVSRLRRAAAVIGAAQATQEFAGSMWRNGVHPSGVIMGDGRMGEDQANQLARWFREAFGGPRNAAKAMILDQGLKWQSISVSPEHAELLASRRFTVEELARIFGVPPPIIGDLTHGTFTNTETVGRWFASHTLVPWIAKLQAEAKRSLFGEATRASHELEFDLSGLLRGDPELRWKSHEIATRAGILTPNEVRELEGWPPRPDANQSPAIAAV